MQSKTRRLVNMAVLVALAVLLMVTIQIPLFTDFLKYDPSDVPMLIGGFWFGPVAGAAMVFVKAFIYLFVKGVSGPIGAFQNFMASGSFVFFASLYYSRHRSRKGAAVALLIGSLAMTVVMIPTNRVILPIWGVPEEIVMDMILRVVTPFNLTKGLISSVLTYFVYKRVKSVLENLWGDEMSSQIGKAK